MPDYAACVDRECPKRGECARYRMDTSESLRQTTLMPPLWDEGCSHFLAFRYAPFRLVSLEGADARAKRHEEVNR